MLSDLMQAFCRLERAPIVKPRGNPVKELRGVVLEFSEPLTDRWLNFKARKLNLDYIRTELRWYLDGDPYDHSIADHASIWKSIVAKQNYLPSNYGKAWFGDRQIKRCVDTLRKDNDSRRAVVVIGDALDINPDMADVPCTMYQFFAIRDGRLEASTHMRSQDAIFGLGNDLPAFVFVQEIVARCLGIELGPHYLHVDSFHIYERHFKMLERILDSDRSRPPVDVPRMPEDFAQTAMQDAGAWRDAEPSDFTRWLTA